VIINSYSDQFTNASLIPRQSRGLYFCEPLKAAMRGRYRGPGVLATSTVAGYSSSFS